MGTEAVWLPYVLAAVGAGAGAVNQHSIAQKQESIQNKGIAQQASRQREADERVNREIAAQTRSTPEEEKAASLGAFTDQLAKAKSTAAGPGDAFTGSDRYQTDSAAGKSAIANYGAQQADLQSKILAPQFQRQREGVSRLRTAGDLGGIKRNAEGDAWINQLLASSVHGNPALEIGGALATGASQAMAAGAGSIPSSAETHAMLAPSRNAFDEMLKKMRTAKVVV